jgi:hypothetical protein
MKELSARDQRALRFAKAELGRVLGALSMNDLASHVRLDLVGRAQSGPLRDLKADGFAIVPEAGEYRIISRCARGIVYGVYGLLESLGCRWYFPGDEGECLPPRPASPPGRMVIENPDTPYRSVVVFWHRTGPGRRERIREYLDFAVRSRYNRFYLHWPTRLRSAAKQAREQGHGLEIGIKLHTARELLPTTLFPSHPEWFRLENGKRTRKYNLCVSNPHALAEVSRNAQKLAESVEVDIAEFAYWQDDVANAWCQCRACRDLSPSDQNLRLMTAILKGVRAYKPGARVSFLSYYATAAPPGSSAIPKGLFMEFAPHACCYRHDLDDPKCPKNALLLEHLEQNLQRFDVETAHVFEYWLDLALFSFYRPPARRLPLLPERMSHDVGFYRSLGISEIETVQWLPPVDVARSPEVANPGFALLPRLLWNPHQDITAFMREFSRDFYGSESVSGVLRLVAQADRANPRYLCAPAARGSGPGEAAGLLKQAVERCQELEDTVTGRHRERVAGLRRALQYDLTRAAAGDA